jgi:hypothetical protein
MSVQIKGDRLKKLVTEEGIAAFRKALGLTFDNEGRQRFDRGSVALEATRFDIGEIAHAFLGSRQSDHEAGLQEIKAAGGFTGIMARDHIAHGPQAIAMEAEGGMVTPSTLSHVGGFVATVGGLLDALIMQQLDRPELLFDRMVTVRSTTTNGGKIIGCSPDGQYGSELLPGQPLPSIGLNEKWVWARPNKKFGFAIQLLLETILYDRTDQMQSAAAEAAYAVLRSREQRVADVVQGMVNTYVFNQENPTPFSADTFQASAGTNPFDYVNSAAGKLKNWNNLNVAVQTLNRNTDPMTGWEIEIPDSEAVLFVSPDRVMNARTIVRAIEVGQRQGTQSEAQATAVNLDTRRAANPIETNYPIVSSRIWFNRLTQTGTHYDGSTIAALSDADAVETWLFGSPKKAYQYRELIPFRSYQAVLSSDDQRRDIVATHIVEEAGECSVVEPRYMFKGTPS